MRDKKRKFNYRKLYGLENIPDGWHVHHINWNDSINDIDNLIAVPKIVHRVIHSTNVYNKYDEHDEDDDETNFIMYQRSPLWDRSTIVKLINIYKKNESAGEKKIEKALKDEIENLYAKELAKYNKEEASKPKTKQKPPSEEEKMEFKRNAINREKLDRFFEKHPEISSSDQSKALYIHPTDILDMFTNYDFDNPNEDKDRHIIFEIEQKVQEFKHIFEGNNY